MRRALVPAATLLLVAGTLLAPGLGSAKDEKTPVYPDKAKTMEIDGVLQFRYTHIDSDEDADTRPVSSFAWKRARLRFSGDLTDRLYYQWRFQADDLPVSGEDGKGAFGFSSTFLGYHVPHIGDIEVGRFDTETTPRSSSTRQAFAERPYHIERNKGSSQLGAVWSNDFLKKRILAAVGVYNGNGDNNPDDWGDANDNANMMVGGRLYISPYEKFPFTTESDIKHSDFGFGAILGGWMDSRGDGSSRADIKTYGAAVMAKGKGLFALADFTMGNSSTDYANKSKSLDRSKRGWSAQVSYAIPIPGKMFIEPKARYEEYRDSNKDDTKSADPSGHFGWTTVGVNWFISGFDATVNLDYIFKKEKGDVESVDNNTLMLQGNMYF